MARVTQITIGVTDSVKLEEYQYVKPTMEFTLELEEGDLMERYVEEARERLLNEMKKLKKDLIKQHQNKKRSGFSKSK